MQQQMDDYQLYIHKSRYARFIDEKQRREHWDETVERLITFYLKRFPAQEQPLRDLQKEILSLNVMPSMRSLMTAGPALEYDNIAGYNCSYVVIDNIKAFSEALFILMCGTGLGFSVERQFIIHLPTIAEDFFDTDTTIVVKDSKLGWATALHELLSLLYSGRTPKWDLSKLRLAGARLKTFGGRSSGPAPLDDLFKFCTKMFQKAAGRKLNSLECHDILCKIGEIVVVGGVRRSALISLSNLSDERLRNAKNGQWWEDYKYRELSNNSVAYTEKPDIGVFMKEWLTLYESKSGERGIFNRVSAVKQAKATGRRDPDYEFGTNPCITGDTLIAVADGRNAISIAQLVAEEKDVPVYSTDVISGQIQIKMGRNPRLTGRAKEVFKVTLDDGSSFKTTANHKVLLRDLTYVEVSSLVEGDSICPFNTFNSNGYRQIVGVGAKMAGGRHRNRRQYRLIHEFFNGFIDAKTYAIHHKNHDSRDDRPENLEVMTHIEHRRLHADLMTGKNNPYFKMTDVWKQKFATHLGPANGRHSGFTDAQLIEHGQIIFKKHGKITPALWIQHAKENKLPQYIHGTSRFGSWNNFKNQVATNHKVVSVEACGVEDVYNITVDDNHNYHIITSSQDLHHVISSGVCIKNCGEIILRPNEFCNLSEVIVRDGDSLDRLKEKVVTATVLGTFQSTLTDFRYIRSTWRKNCEEERLLGVSLTGIMDHKVLSGRDGIQKLEKWLDELKILAIDTNKVWAEKLGVNQSVAITTVKPSGTVSQLTNAASGIHPRYAQYYIRTVRQDKKDPIGQFLKNAGVPCEDAQGKEDQTWVFAFPHKAPAHAVFRDQMSAIEQLDHYLTFKKHWCEHNPSITVYVKETEWLDVGAWVYKNFNDIGGIAFLPHSDHIYKQAPYQEITKEQYVDLVANMPKIDWESFKEDDDNVEGAKELACSSGICEI